MLVVFKPTEVARSPLWRAQSPVCAAVEVPAQSVVVRSALPRHTPVIHTDLHAPPPPRDVYGEVLSSRAATFVLPLSVHNNQLYGLNTEHTECPVGSACFRALLMEDQQQDWVEDDFLTGGDDVYSGKEQPTFRRNILCTVLPL
jgi:hypothetical protein